MPSRMGSINHRLESEPYCEKVLSRMEKMEELGIIQSQPDIVAFYLRDLMDLLHPKRQPYTTYNEFTQQEDISHQQNIQ